MTPIPTPPKVVLPAYPASAGPNTAAQSEATIQRYRGLVRALQAELEACEAAFEVGFGRVDASAQTRDRINNLAAAARRNRRGLRQPS